MSMWHAFPCMHSPVATLDSLGLVQDHILPLDALEVLDVLYHKLVAGDEDMERSILVVQELLVPVLADDLALVRTSPVWEGLRNCSYKSYWCGSKMSYLELGHKSGALLLPVVQSGCRRHYQEGAPDALVLWTYAD